MALGTQVPWTYPGGPPCCCDESVCQSDLLSFLNFTSANSSRVLLTNQQYTAIKTPNTLLRAEVTVTVSGAAFFIGTVASYSPNPLVSVSEWQFPATAINLVGYGSTRCRQFVGSNTVLVTLSNSSGGIENATLRGFAFQAVLQDAGQGISPDFPLTQPALYLKGRVVELLEAVPSNNYETSFGSGGGLTGTAFGQSIPLTATNQGGLNIGVTFNLNFAPP